MKIKQMLRWLCETSLTSFCGFYISMYAILLISWIVSLFFPSAHVNMQTFSVSPQVMLFVYGIVQFYGATRFGLGHGVSRKTIWLSFLLLSAAMAVMVLPMNLFGEWLGKIAGMDTRPVETYLYLSTCDVESRGFFFGLMAERICSVLFCGCLGYFIGGVYYRLNNFGKWAVSIGVPLGLLVVLPLIITYLFTSEMRIWLKNAVQEFVMLFLLKTPWNLALFFFVLAVILAAASFPLIRKAPLKTAK